MPEIWIETTPLANNHTFALGQSRIGGTPDLPATTPWPRHRWTHAETKTWPDYAQQELAEAIASGQVLEDTTHIALALPFVAQLDLAALANIAPGQTLLPRTGHLWLFADQQTTLGQIEHDAHQACACLYAEAADLVPTPSPPVPENLPALVAKFVKADGKQEEPRHAVFPEAFGGVNGPSPPESYTGILRVDSDYSLEEGLNWGDAAWITFAIPPADLAARRWEAMRAFRFHG